MLRILGALLLLAGPAGAQDLVSFQTPSGNIHCMGVGSGPESFVDCEVIAMSGSPIQERPAGCDLDWGRRFVVGAFGPAQMACAGDTVRNPEGDVILYGEVRQFGSVTCVSSREGLECSNTDGHGFRLSRAAQSLF